MSETISAEVPISIRWTQELVDDGSGGENFYVRLTPKIDRRVSRVKLKNLMTVIQRLKREKTNEIKKAAKQGAEQGIKSDVYAAQKRKKEMAEYKRQAQAAEETRQQNEMFGPQISSSMFEKKMWEEAQRRGDTLNVVKEEPEKEDEKEKEKIYYIK